MTKNFRFFSQFFVLVLFLLGGVPLFSFSKTHSVQPVPDSIQKIKDRGYLIVSMIRDDDPPYVMKNPQGQMIGIDISLAQDIAKNMGVDLKILRTATTYDDVVEQVFQGKADIGISNLSITLGRAEKVNYSIPYVSLKKTILLNRGHFFRTRQRENDSLESFFQKGHKLGVMKGSSYVEFSKMYFPKAEIAEYPTNEDLLHALDTQQIAGVFWDEFEMEKVIFLSPGGPIRYFVVKMNVPSDKSAMVLPKQDLDFLQWVDTFLELSRRTFKIQDVLNMYMAHLREKK